MKVISHLSGKLTLALGVLAISTTLPAYSQTLINLGTQGRNIDFSNAPSTRPEKTGSSLPAACLAGELFFNLTAPAGQNLYGCAATNTWTLLGGAGSGSGTGLADPGSNGLVVRTALNATTTVPVPAGTIVGTTDTQTLTNKTIDGVSPITFGFVDATSSIQMQLNAKQAKLSFTGTGSQTVSATAPGTSGHCAQWTAAGDIGDSGASCGSGGGTGSPGGTSGQIQYNNAGAFGGLSTIPAANMPAYTGDVTSPAGSTTNTLATVNSTPGTYGSTTLCPTLTVNAKGLVTAISQTACGGSGGAAGITQLTGDVTTPASSSGSAVATLASVNSTPGTFGNGTATPVITVNSKGLITAVTTAAISGTGGSSTATALASGTLANLPAACAPGAVYFSTDQPVGQQIYTCSSTNTWNQIVSLGPSGALAYSNGSLDIVTSVVPRLTAANSFSGLNAFSDGLQLTTAAAGQPSCSFSTRGLFWYQNNGASKDGLQICVYNGSSYSWTTLY